MVSNGQLLASLSDTRLVALNIAREGLESVTTLRDTFSLANYSSGTCSTGSVAAFFTTNGSQILTDNCPVMVTSPVPPLPPTPAATPYYILDDNKGLTVGTINDTHVCINEYGWYSQQYSVKSDTPGPIITCLTETDFCSDNTTQSCKT
jgi:hypothetical protein